MLPFLEAFYRDFYYPDQTTFGNEVDESDHMAKAVVVSGNEGDLLNHIAKVATKLTWWSYCDDSYGK